MNKQQVAELLKLKSIIGEENWNALINMILCLRKHLRLSEAFKKEND